MLYERAGEKSALSAASTVDFELTSSVCIKTDIASLLLDLLGHTGVVFGARQTVQAEAWDSARSPLGLPHQPSLSLVQGP